MNHLIEGGGPPVEPKLPEKDVKFQGAEVGGFVVAVLVSAAKSSEVPCDEPGYTAMQDNTSFNDQLKLDE